MKPLLEQRLQVHVEKLASEIGERNVWLPKALHAAADYIRDTWGQLGYEVHAQGYDAGGVWSENLEIEIRGDAQAKEIVLDDAEHEDLRITGLTGLTHFEDRRSLLPDREFIESLERLRSESASGPLKEAVDRYLNRTR